MFTPQVKIISLGVGVALIVGTFVIQQKEITTVRQTVVTPIVITKVVTPTATPSAVLTPTKMQYKVVTITQPVK